jgi:hypothetical protein
VDCSAGDQQGYTLLMLNRDDLSGLPSLRLTILRE